jgi:hypothetical protein
MSLLGCGLVLASRARGLQLAGRCKDPRPAQEAALRRLLARAANTAFGRHYRFHRIDGPAAFRDALPLHRYEDLAPWFERARQGESDVVWPGRTEYFAMSSGTTAGNKYLPISHDSIRQQKRGGFDPVASYLRWTSDHGLLEKKAILLGSTSTLERNGAGIWTGDNTGIMAHFIPRAVLRNYLPSPAVRAIRDWDVRIDALVRESIDEDVRLLAGTPSWFAGLFDRLLEEARRRGRRARHVHDVWPNLRLMTGGGVAFEPYRALLRSRLGTHVPYVDVYNATEGGIMGVQDRPEQAELLLLPDTGVYYEFVPLDELSGPKPRRLSLWEVETDVVYALVLSTMSGIFSYLLGDCLRFTELFPHRFVFEGRTAAFLNVCGEHVSQGELERAVRNACEELKVSPREFCVSADVGVDGSAAVRHIFMIEFDGAVPDLQRCAQLIDGALSAHNDDYLVHRSSASGLLAPEVSALEFGAFEQWMRQRGALGGQHKVPRVVLDSALRRGLQTRTLATPAHSGNGVGEPRPSLQ